MTAVWVLNTVSLFSMTSGALLFFLGLWETPRAADDRLAPEQRRNHLRRRRLLAVGGGLLSLWFVIQYLWVIIA